MFKNVVKPKEENCCINWMKFVSFLMNSMEIVSAVLSGASIKTSRKSSSTFSLTDESGSEIFIFHFDFDLFL